MVREDQDLTYIHNTIKNDFPQYTPLLTGGYESGPVSAVPGFFRQFIEDANKKGKSLYHEQVNKVTSSDYRTKVQTLLRILPIMEDSVRDIWPVSHTPKSLFSVRLSVMLNVLVQYHKSAHPDKLRLQKLLYLCEGSEYEAVRGLCIQLILYPLRNRPFIIMALADSVKRDDLIIAEKLFEPVKADTSVPFSEIQYYAEGSGLYGLPARPTLDTVLQGAKAWLGEADKRKFGEYNKLFNKMALNSPVQSGGTTLSFTDWLSEASNWARTGSSSVGRLSFVFGEDEKSVKCTKNNLVYSIPLSVIDDLVTHWDPQVDPAIINIIVKMEPKLTSRLAAADDVRQFLVMNYVFDDYIGRVYDMSVVLREDPRALISSYILLRDTMVTKNQDFVWVSFDFKEFDKQQDLRDMYPVYLAFLLQNNASDVFKQKVLESVPNNVAVIKEEGTEIRFPVKSGLESGLYSTNFIGSLINRAAKRTSEILSGSEAKQYFIKGDDLAIAFETKEKASMWLAAMLAGGNTAKPEIFGMAHNSFEFLRRLFRFTNIDKGVIGYPLRVQWYQSKDWNAPAPSIESRLNKVSSGVKSVFDRGVKGLLPEIAREELAFWSRKHNIDMSWGFIPSEFGGLGLFSYLFWKGEYFMRNNKIAKVKTPGAAVYQGISISNIPLETIISARPDYERYRSVTTEQIRAMLSATAAKTISTNHLPSEVKDRMKRFNFPANVKKVNARLAPISEDLISQTSVLLATGSNTYYPLVWFNKYRTAAEDLGYLNELKDIVDPTIKIVSELDKFHPGFENDVINLRKFNIGRKIAIDILVFGKFPIVAYVPEYFYSMAENFIRAAAESIFNKTLTPPDITYSVSMALRQIFEAMPWRDEIHI